MNLYVDYIACLCYPSLCLKGEQMFRLLTYPRRSFLAKALMDVVKLLLVAGLASGFFVQHPYAVRLSLGIAIPVLFVLSWLLFPPKGD